MAHWTILLQKEKDLANQKIIDEFPDVYKGYVQDLGEAESEVKSAKSEFDKINNAYQQLQNSGGMVQAFDKDSLWVLLRTKMAKKLQLN